MGADTIALRYLTAGAEILQRYGLCSSVDVDSLRIAYAGKGEAFLLDLLEREQNEVLNTLVIIFGREGVQRSIARLSLMDQAERWIKLWEGAIPSFAQLARLRFNQLIDVSPNDESSRRIWGGEAVLEVISLIKSGSEELRRSQSVSLPKSEIAPEIAEGLALLLNVKDVKEAFFPCEDLSLQAQRSALKIFSLAMHHFTKLFGISLPEIGVSLEFATTGWREWTNHYQRQCAVIDADFERVLDHVRKKLPSTFAILANDPGLRSDAVLERKLALFLRRQGRPAATAAQASKLLISYTIKNQAENLLAEEGVTVHPILNADTIRYFQKTKSELSDKGSILSALESLE